MWKKRAVLIPVAILALVVIVIGVSRLRYQNRERKHRGEGMPLGALKTITNSQSIFREGDKEGDSNEDYGTLTELSDQGLIDDLLGAGTKQGYVFAAWPSPTTSEYLWFGYANSIQSDEYFQYDVHFCINQSGQTWKRRSKPFTRDEIGDDCEPPSDAVPLQDPLPPPAEKPFLRQLLEGDDD